VSNAFVSCNNPSTTTMSWVQDSSDCDDARIAVNPASQETCANAYDDDCDGDSNDDQAIGCTDYYVDEDDDGYGTSTTLCICLPQDDYTATQSGDCDDAVAVVHPNQLENCSTGFDDNCDGNDNDSGGNGCIYYYSDNDADGYGISGDSACLCETEGLYTALFDGDCDDDNMMLNPSIIEVCDGIDNDCSGDVDVNATDASPWYLDDDGDGYGLISVSVIACDQPSGYSSVDGDCNDGMPNVNPAQAEDCATIYDDDCNNNNNDENATSCSTFWLDSDVDGYGDASDSLCLCYGENLHTSTSDQDCDDSNDLIHPNQLETCDTTEDDDCDGDINEDDSVNCFSHYYDFDGDGYGITDYVCACAGYDYYTATDLGDCDDGDAYTNPGEENCGLMGELIESSAVATMNAWVNVLSGFDYNQDGHDDILVGNTGYDTQINNAGAALLFFGPIVGSLDVTTPADADLVFSPNDSSTGYSLGVGDFDGDGWVEFIVTSSGQAYLIDDGLDGPGTLTENDTGITNFSTVSKGIVSVGDINDDGFDDAALALGFSNQGRIAYGGSAGFTIVDEDIDSYHWGANVDGQFDGGDLDGDGVADLLNLGPESGAIGRVYFGGASSTGGIDATPDVEIPNSTDSYYNTIHYVGDVTGDGLGDMMMTRRTYDLYDPVSAGLASDVGAVWLFSGESISDPLNPPTDVSDANWILHGDSSDYKVGRSVVSGDIDADGVGDVLVNTGSSAAPVLFYGPLSTTGGSYDTSQAAAYMSNEGTGLQNCCPQNMNFSSADGDINNDGFDDVLVTSSTSYGGSYYDEYVWLLFGAVN
jgi:hypothetical protein